MRSVSSQQAASHLIPSGGVEGRCHPSLTPLARCAAAVASSAVFDRVLRPWHRVLWCQPSCDSCIPASYRHLPAALRCCSRLAAARLLHSRLSSQVPRHIRCPATAAAASVPLRLLLLQPSLHTAMAAAVAAAVAAAAGLQRCSPSRKPFLKRRCTLFRCFMRPVPVVLRPIAFTLQLSADRRPGSTREKRSAVKCEWAQSSCCQDQAASIAPSRCVSGDSDGSFPMLRHSPAPRHAAAAAPAAAPRGVRYRCLNASCRLRAGFHTLGYATAFANTPAAQPDLPSHTAAPNARAAPNAATHTSGSWRRGSRRSRRCSSGCGRSGGRSDGTACATWCGADQSCPYPAKHSTDIAAAQHTIG